MTEAVTMTEEELVLKKLEKPLMEISEQLEHYLARWKELWKEYCSRVRKHQSLLEVTEEICQHLLFFAPSSFSDESSRWTEILFGFLQFNRLSIDLARNEETGKLDRSHNRFGTSVSVSSSTLSNSFPATGVRIALTILQCLWPVAQELVKDPSNPTRTAQRQSRVRCLLEKLRFILRFGLVANYWKCILKQKLVQPGILLDGGMFSDRPAPSVQQELARVERAQYRGSRTGRKVTRNTPPRLSRKELDAQIAVDSDQLGLVGRSDDENLKQPNLTMNTYRVMLGEMLYLLRPLVQAEGQQSAAKSGYGLKRLWLLCLSMDIASLVALHGPCTSYVKTETGDIGGNVVSDEEWKRRRMRLLLYLLRAPVWNRGTKPIVHGVSAVVDAIPLVGGLLQNYLWDWIYYWKLYRAEEG